jgi:hypothetical protein
MIVCESVMDEACQAVSEDVLLSWWTVLRSWWMWSVEQHDVVLDDVESGIASVKRWSAWSTMGSVAELSNVVACLLMCLH